MFLVLRRFDMREGPTAVVEDSTWFNRDKALAYINSKPGIDGRMPATGSWETEPDGGDWCIKELSIKEYSKLSLPLKINFKELWESHLNKTQTVHVVVTDTDGDTVCGVPNSPDIPYSAGSSRQTCAECLTIIWSKQ